MAEENDFESSKSLLVDQLTLFSTQNLGFSKKKVGKGVMIPSIHLLRTLAGWLGEGERFGLVSPLGLPRVLEEINGRAEPKSHNCPQK